MTFFTWLQETSFAHWVASDPSLLACPTTLFTTDAERKAMPMVFFIKLSLILLALAVYVRLRKLVFTSAAPSVVRRSDRSQSFVGAGFAGPSCLRQ